MVNLVLITSVINTPNTPLSYSKIRSVFKIEQRSDNDNRNECHNRSRIHDERVVIGDGFES